MPFLALHLILIASLLAVHAEPAPGEQRDDGSFNLHYAFANQLGSGIYDVKGNRVQIYRP